MREFLAVPSSQLAGLCNRFTLRVRSRRGSRFRFQVGYGKSNNTSLQFAVVESVILSNEDFSNVQRLEDQATRYRRVLEKEIASQRLLSRITLATGVGLILAGIATTYYYYPLGWLLILVGILRALNTFYDLRRRDDLDLKLRQLDREFGRVTSERSSVMTKESR